jgi:hypothetical protein
MVIWNICFTNVHGYVPLVVITSLFFPHSWLITGCVTRLTRRVSLVEQELPYPSGAPEFTPGFSGVRVTRSLVLCVCFVDRCLSFCTFSFGHCVLLRITDSDYLFGILRLFLINISKTIISTNTIYSGLMWPLGVRVLNPYRIRKFWTCSGCLVLLGV